MTRTVTAGFTAVEILITLVIAALLLIGSHQAYSLVISNTKESRERAIASSYGYDALKQLETSYALSPCQAQAEADFPEGIIPVDPDIQIVSSRYAVSCPYGSDGVTKIITKVTYGDSGEEVTHAIYALGS